MSAGTGNRETKEDTGNGTAERTGRSDEINADWEEAFDYHTVAVNCLRFFHFSSFAEIDALTIPEYEMLMEAHELAKIDREYEIARQAFENQRIQATKGSKRPTAVYKTLESFYDHKGNIKKIKEIFRKDKNGEENEGSGLDFSALIKYKREKEEKEKERKI